MKKHQIPHTKHGLSVMHPPSRRKAKTGNRIGTKSSSTIEYQEMMKLQTNFKEVISVRFKPAEHVL
jgi:hypothetical protein